MNKTKVFANKQPNKDPKNKRKSAPGKHKHIKIAGLVVIALLISGVLMKLSDTNKLSIPLKNLNISVSHNSDSVVVVAGDIACDPKSPYFNGGIGDKEHCHMRQTAQITSQISPTSVLVLGDNQYEKGEHSNYTASYDLSWGTLKGLTKPVPGNHEYYTPGAAGYFQYFGPSAHKESDGYYSYNQGKWHIIALNSNCAEIGGCGTASTQYKWLAEDLNKNTSNCTLAFWHHPRFSSGEHGNDPITQDFWSLLYDKKADLILNGHEHIYERFSPQNPAGISDPVGITQVIVGTGGKDLTPIKSIQPNSEVRQNSQFGVLRLTLHENSYSWKYFAEKPSDNVDVGSASCH